MNNVDTQERPLVTFALFAYNQEKYIHEAIEAAFAQTYQPLEIILSDDCSSDKTFEIMVDSAEKYTGPHRVIVRRTKYNRGTFNHVLEVYTEMSGRLMILGAGDDISYETRCEVTVDEWLRSGATVLFSQYEKISDSGTSLGVEESSGDREITAWFPNECRKMFNHGATTAYDHCLFAGLKFSDDPIFSEDAVFYFLSMIKNYEIRKISRPLVKYRQAINSISNNVNVKESKIDVENFERKISWMAHSYLALCDYALEFLRSDAENAKVKERILNTRRFSKIRAEWLNKTIFGRLTLFLKCRSWRELRFLAPRVFGLKCFSTIKAARAGLKR